MSKVGWSWSSAVSKDQVYWLRNWKWSTELISKMQLATTKKINFKKEEELMNSFQSWIFTCRQLERPTFCEEAHFILFHCCPHIHVWLLAASFFVSYRKMFFDRPFAQKKRDLIRQPWSQVLTRTLIPLMQKGRKIKGCSNWGPWYMSPNWCMSPPTWILFRHQFASMICVARSILTSLTLFHHHNCYLNFVSFTKKY